MKVNSFEELGKVFGLSPRKPQESWAKEQKDKLLKCPHCGGEMGYIDGTNIVICQNIIMKDNKEKICGYRRLLNDKTTSFLKYVCQ